MDPSSPSARDGSDVRPFRGTAELELLRPVLEMAIAVARQGEAETPRVVAPLRLRPFIGFQRLPSKAMGAARKALDEDEPFRQRVTTRFRDGDLEVGVMAWLIREEGWREVFSALVERAAEELRDDAARQNETKADRRLGSVEDALERRTAELAEVRNHARELEAELEQVAGLAELATERARLIDTLEAELARAIKDLKATERRLAARIAENKTLRSERDAAIELVDATRAANRPESDRETGSAAKTAETGTLDGEESARASAPNTGSDPAGLGNMDGQRGPSAAAEGLCGDDAQGEQSTAAHNQPSEVADDVARETLADLGIWIADAATAAAALAEALGGAVQRLGSLGDAVGPTPPFVGVADIDAAPRVASTPALEPVGPAKGSDFETLRLLPPISRRNARQPLRPTRGLVEGSEAAIEAILEAPSLVVLVDGYNASIALWPHLDLPNQREALLTAMGRLRARTGADIRLVFDGDAAGGRPSVTSALPVRVEFTRAGLEADDRLIEIAGLIPAERPVAVVTGDRRVQTGVKAVGANVIEPLQIKALLLK